MASFRARGPFILNRDDGTAKFYPKGDISLKDDHPDGAHFYFLANTDPIDGDGNVVPRGAPVPTPVEIANAEAKQAIDDAIAATVDDRERANAATRERIAEETAKKSVVAQQSAAKIARDAS